LQAQGLLVAHVPYAKVMEQARAYLAEHPELLAQAIEIVTTHPRYRPFVEREERDRERQQRKRLRNGVVEKPSGRPVT
jgi:hypothetical protein